MQDIHVLIVEDDADVRSGFKSILSSANWSTRVVAVDNCQSALKLLNKHQYDLLFVDIGLPDGCGLDIITYLNSNDCAVHNVNKATQSVVISMFDDEQTVMNAIKAGACSYILKDALPDNILTLAEEVLSGNVFISPRIAHYLIKTIRMSPSVRTPDKSSRLQLSLTTRELDVLNLVAKGYSTSEVADLLKLSYHTIASHIKNIYKKLQVSSRNQAIYEARQYGII